MVCPDCGYTFPPPSTIKKAASSEDILRTTKPTEPQIEEFEVLGIRYKPETSKAGNRYFQVTYSVGTARFREPVFFDHPNRFLVQRAQRWWLYRKGSLPAPQDADEAAERAPNELRVPDIIRVDISNKYPEIVGAEFKQTENIIKAEPADYCTCKGKDHLCDFCESLADVPF
jgi:hypothetical protein